MTTALILLFWSCLGLVAYAYAGYPLLAAWLAHRHGTHPREAGRRDDEACPALTVVVAAYDEEARIAARIADILAQDYPAAAPAGAGRQRRQPRSHRGDRDRRRRGRSAHRACWPCRATSARRSP